MFDFKTLAIGCLLLSLSACADKQPQPIVAPSSGAPSYAIGYADQLSAETALLVADKQQATEQSQKLDSRTSELKPGIDPEVLRVVVRQADEAGRGDAYVRECAKARDLKAFWAEERGPISARANSAAQKQLTESNCGACGQTDLSGPMTYAIGNGIDRQLEKRLRAANEAHRTIENNEARLGSAANVAIVQQLADDIALTSYQVNVALPQSRNRVDGLLAEKDDVDETLEKAVEWERTLQAAQTRSAAEKKASQKRLEVLEKSRAAIPPAATNAEAARKDLDPQIEALRKRYAETMEKLEANLEAQAERANAAK